MGEDLTKTIAKLRERVKCLLAGQRLSCPSRRVLIAVAGVPGSGKSTITAALLEDLKRHAIENVAILPMDGFHYSRATLSSFSDPDLALRRRGAPFTFDAAGFLNLVRQLRTTPIPQRGEPQIVIRAPSFDHAAKDPLPGAIVISSRTEVVLIEGNYTLLNQEPWSGIADLVDDRWFVDVSVEEAQKRLAARHLQAGIEKTLELALLRATENDVPNGAHIRSNLIEPTIRILN
ncbi:phosphoribulokinase uridine kinase family protein (nicotinamide riboside kinase) [Colletotrichum tofieldiae]|uniref:Phosphoribulokinase uridine kinase family protein (Nicotinamide riboside kinase) n=1 Tax=Colletotrichum tofieldiae TaxID=708197 RepID=A0A166YT82_9PEZI|nr:phosphoribulokinase uridine kinase family protein (nicotinamide riboside kinase) [Colletotrichum tofieldiae]GKT96590.1 phosphoribulokinase uridine kinase family protein [Colletotrichum tofieldiae]